MKGGCHTERHSRSLSFRIGTLPLRRVKLIMRRQHMKSPGGESERGSVIDFALIVILFSIVLITIAVLLGPAITDFFSRLVVR